MSEQGQLQRYEAEKVQAPCKANAELRSRPSHSPISELTSKTPSGNSPPHQRRDISNTSPFTSALSAFGGKWKLIILSHLAESPIHFGAMRQAMPGISQKVLTQQLREL